MPDRENGDVLRVEVIKSDVATAAEVDQPFPKRRVHILHRAAEVRLLGQNLDPRSYRRYRALRGSASSPASNFASQASASSAVRCRPVC
jgi:hypothetical protein